MQKVALKLLRKKLGLRMLMDIIALDASLVNGSHSRTAAATDAGPLLMSRHVELLPDTVLGVPAVFDVTLAHLREAGKSESLVAVMAAGVVN